MKKIIIMILVVLGAVSMKASSTTLNYQVYLPKSVGWGVYKAESNLTPLTLSRTPPVTSPPTYCQQNPGTFGCFDTPPYKPGPKYGSCLIYLPFPAGIMSNMQMSGSGPFRLTPCGKDNKGTDACNVTFTGGINLKDLLSLARNSGYGSGTVNDRIGEALRETTLILGQGVSTSENKIMYYPNQQPTNLIYSHLNPIITVSTINDLVKKCSLQLSIGQYIPQTFQLSLNFQQQKLGDF